MLRLTLLVFCVGITAAQHGLNAVDGSGRCPALGGAAGRGTAPDMVEWTPDDVYQWLSSVEAGVATAARAMKIDGRQLARFNRESWHALGISSAVTRWRLTRLVEEKRTTETACANTAKADALDVHQEESRAEPQGAVHALGKARIAAFPSHDENVAVYLSATFDPPDPTDSRKPLPGALSSLVVRGSGVMHGPRYLLEVTLHLICSNTGTHECSNPEATSPVVSHALEVAVEHGDTSFSRSFNVRALSSSNYILVVRLTDAHPRVEKLEVGMEESADEADDDGDGLLALINRKLSLRLQDQSASPPVALRTDSLMQITRPSACTNTQHFL